MKYSIIIPTLNEEKLLPNILNQLRENNILSKYDAEIIISDGGSSDQTLFIAQNYTNNIIKFREGYRQNIAQGRNIGANYATGEILVFFGADISIPDADYFFGYLENIFVQSSYAAMTCNVKIDPQSEIFSDKVFHLILNSYFYLLNIFGIGMGRGEVQVIKKKVFCDFNGYNETLAAGEDFDLFRRIRKKYKILFERKLFIYESPRRYRKYGYLNVCKSWFLNAYSVIFKNKSLDREWEQIR